MRSIHGLSGLLNPLFPTFPILASLFSHRRYLYMFKSSYQNPGLVWYGGMYSDQARCIHIELNPYSATNQLALIVFIFSFTPAYLSSAIGLGSGALNVQ